MKSDKEQRMQSTLAFICFGIGWPVLIAGSVWMWSKSVALQGLTKTLLNTTLISFYALGFVSTMYWLGKPWFTGVLPVFVVFLVLFYMLVRAFIKADRPAS
jgi:hypothetical protein